MKVDIRFQLFLKVLKDRFRRLQKIRALKMVRSRNGYIEGCPSVNLGRCQEYICIQTVVSHSDCKKEFCVWRIGAEKESIFREKQRERLCHRDQFLLSFFLAFLLLPWDAFPTLLNMFLSTHSSLLTCSKNLKEKQTKIKHTFKKVFLKFIINSI